jgi:hypothetical protein
MLLYDTLKEPDKSRITAAEVAFFKEGHKIHTVWPQNKSKKLITQGVLVKTNTCNNKWIQHVNRTDKDCHMLLFI